MFLKESRFLGSRRMYFVLTCGSGTGKAAEHAREVCREISMDFCGLASVRMPENFITLFRAPEADEAVGIIRAAMPQLEVIGNQILSDRTITDSYAGPAMPNFFYRIFYGKAFICYIFAPDTQCSHRNCFCLILSTVKMIELSLLHNHTLHIIIVDPL